MKQREKVTRQCVVCTKHPDRHYPIHGWSPSAPLAETVAEAEAEGWRIVRVEPWGTGSAFDWRMEKEVTL